MVLDAAVIVGLLITFLQGTDLLLRPYQQQKLQELIEELTLRAEDIDLPRVRERITTPEAQILFVWFAVIQIAVIVLVGTLVIVALFPREADIRPDPPLPYLLSVMMLVSYLGPLGFAWKWPLPRIIGWVFKDPDLGSIKRRRRAFTSSLMVVLCLFQLSLLCFFAISEEFVSKYFFYLMLPMYPVLAVFHVAHQAIRVALKPEGLLTRITLACCRAVLWRVVEYKKGVVAALTLLVTIILGTIKLWLSR